jgi:prevent-host-death family protein
MTNRHMKRLNLAEAKARFSELVDAAARGNGTIISKSGTPVAMLVPLDQGKHAPIKFGTLKGKIWIADNFDDPLPDVFSANSSEAEARFRWNLPSEVTARYSNCAVGYDRCPADQGEATDRGSRCCLCQRRIALGNLHQGIAW